jgi:peroxiredoxin Q/BCP
MVQLKVGMRAPMFVQPNQEGKRVSLADFKDKIVVLYFYPKDNTPGCTIEGMEFTSVLPEFKKLGVEVIGVSPDSVKSHCNFIAKQKLRVELLSDESKKMLEVYGVWGKKKFMGKEYMGVLRTTFLIDGKGKVVHIWRDVSVKGHAKEVLERVKKCC